jgi:hypothetical protein
MAEMPEILEPFETYCPECHGAGYMGDDGHPWEGDVNLAVSPSDPYSKCWNPDCREGVVLTDEGKAHLAFLKRHMRVKANTELTML